MIHGRPEGAKGALAPSLPLPAINSMCLEILKKIVSFIISFYVFRQKAWFCPRPPWKFFSGKKSAYAYVLVDVKQILEYPKPLTISICYSIFYLVFKLISNELNICLFWKIICFENKLFLKASSSLKFHFILSCIVALWV